MSNVVWEAIYDRITVLIREHKTTLVFVEYTPHGRKGRATSGERRRRERHRASRQPRPRIETGSGTAKVRRAQCAAAMASLN